jgi:hypothetical protein
MMTTVHEDSHYLFATEVIHSDRPCGLVVRVPG